MALNFGLYLVYIFLKTMIQKINFHWKGIILDLILELTPLFWAFFDIFWICKSNPTYYGSCLTLWNWIWVFIFFRYCPKISFTKSISHLNRESNSSLDAIAGNTWRRPLTIKVKKKDPHWKSFLMGVSVIHFYCQRPPSCISGDRVWRRIWLPV